MTTPQIPEIRIELGQLTGDVLIAVSVLGGVTALLLGLVIGLYVWTSALHRRMKDTYGPVFLPRPKLNKGDNDAQPRIQPYPNTKPAQRYAYDNPGMQQDNYTPGQSNNPIATRGQQNIANDNFSFGNNFAGDAFQPPSSLKNRDRSSFY